MLEPVNDKAGALTPIPQQDDSQPSFMVLEGRLSNNRVGVPANLVTLGSEPSCDIWLPYPEIDRLHAVLAKTTQGWYIRALKSSLISINGRTVQGAPLSQGDRLGIGKLILEFYDNIPMETAKTDFTICQRLHAAALAAQHMETIEQRWALEFKESRIARRARRIASRLRNMAKPQADANQDSQENNHGALGRHQEHEEKLALERARINRLRTRVIARWKKLRAHPDLPKANANEQLRQNPSQHLKEKKTPILRIHSPESAPAANEPNASDLKREISHLMDQRFNLLQEIKELSLKAEKIRSETESIGPVVPATPGGEILRAANLMSQHHADWDLEAEATAKALENELVALAQREHLIAEREALLETLLGQRQRQREELDLTIDEAAKKTRHAIFRAEESEIEVARLRRELELLNEAWDRRLTIPAVSEAPVHLEEWSHLVSRLDHLTESLEKASDWACQNLNASERAELEFLRFNSLIHGITTSDETASGVRSSVDLTCEEIRNRLIPQIEAFLQALNSSWESPDRRLVIEAHRWKVRAETLDKSLMETRALLQKIGLTAHVERPKQAA